MMNSITISKKYTHKGQRQDSTVVVARYYYRTLHIFITSQIKSQECTINELNAIIHKERPRKRNQPVQCKRSLNEKLWSYEAHGRRSTQVNEVNN